MSCSEGISLHTVCHHALYLDRNYNAAQFLQSADRIHRLGLDPNQTTFIEFVFSPGTIDESVNRRLAFKIDQMEQALRELSPGEREVVALRVLLELDGPSAARVLGISQTACSTRLSRALKRLEERMSDVGE